MEEIRCIRVPSIEYFHGILTDLVLDIEIAASQGKGWGWLASNGERLYWDPPVPVEIKEINGRLFIDDSKRRKYLESQGPIFMYEVGVFADEQRPIRMGAIVAVKKRSYALIRFIDGVDLAKDPHSYTSASPIGASFAEFAEYVIQKMIGQKGVTEVEATLSGSDRQVNIMVQEGASMAIFDQRGQHVTYQYNAAGNINFGAVQNRMDVVAELEKLKAEFDRAREAGVFSDEDIVIDAKYQLDKAASQAKKEEPDKKSVLEHLEAAKALIAGVAGAAGLVSALVEAASKVQQFF